MNLSEEKRKELEKKLDIKLPKEDVIKEDGFNKELSKAIIDEKGLNEIEKRSSEKEDEGDKKGA